MIGYEMGTSPTKVYTTAKISLLETFKHGWKSDMDANMAIIFC